MPRKVELTEAEKELALCEEALGDVQAELDEYKTLWRCMEAAGIDNCEAYSIGYQSFLDVYPDSEI